MTRPDAYANNLVENARVASRLLAVVSGDDKVRWLDRTAQLLIERTDEILEANATDISQASENGLSPAAIDRLRLNVPRLESIATALRQVALLPDPIGEIIEGSVRPNGLRISRIRVPLGVVFFIFESRPNVTIDAASLCVKSGNAVILRGGKEALNSNLALYAVIQRALNDVGLPEHSIQLVNTPDRSVVGELLKRGDRIDVTIPRGGKSLIERVTAEATMPVIKHFDGICHVFVDKSAEIEMAIKILQNSKCQRPSACNATECVLIHRDIAPAFLPHMKELFQQQNVAVNGCPITRSFIPWAGEASEDNYRTEYLDFTISCRVVDSLAQAIDHIDQFGSHHTDAIVTNDLSSANTFLASVDSAAVMVNASTRFNDGGEFGLGAEIGISTDKFHARGPCGLRELTSYKWICVGTGQIRK